MSVQEPMTLSEQGATIDLAIERIASLTKEVTRLQGLLLIVANMGVDADDETNQEWVFLEDAAKFAKDNL